MCNACGFLCCGYDGFSGCGCDDCLEPECWSYEDDLYDEDAPDFDFEGVFARPFGTCQPVHARVGARP